MAFGSVGLLMTGSRGTPSSHWDRAARSLGLPVSAAGYGIAAALTLDEFALWLNRDLVREATLIATGRQDARDLL